MTCTFQLATFQDAGTSTPNEGELEDTEDQKSEEEIEKRDEEDERAKEQVNHFKENKIKEIFMRIQIMSNFLIQLKFSKLFKKYV